MQAKEDNEVNDLIVPEDGIIMFQAPSLEAVRGAYSRSFKAKPTKQSTLKLIEELFPKQTSNKVKEKADENPGFSIDEDEDPLII